MNTEHCNAKHLYIGLMSGTSMDGIDVALMDVSCHRLILGITVPYSAPTKARLQTIVQQQKVSMAALCQLNTILGREFAKVILQLLEKAKTDANSIVAIGSHGQTLCHDATADIPYTLQLGCAHTIAELTGITVVADFRTRDMVCGGQGAPFAPLYHQALFAQGELPLAVVNIGGILNISYLDVNGRVCGHDIGPGNCLLDGWIYQQLGHPYDANGAWAATGGVILPLLDALLSDAYFHRAPPKSIGKEYFSAAWLARYLKPAYLPQDVQATLVELNAILLAAAIKSSLFAPRRLVICGGGVHNTTLLQAIRRHIDLPVDSTQTLGVDPDFLEAMMFAWLADKAISQTPLDLKAITGSSKQAILGAIYARGIDKRISIDV